MVDEEPHRLIEIGHGERHVVDRPHGRHSRSIDAGHGVSSFRAAGSGLCAARELVLGPRQCVTAVLRGAHVGRSGMTLEVLQPRRATADAAQLRAGRGVVDLLVGDGLEDTCPPTDRRCSGRRPSVGSTWLVPIALSPKDTQVPRRGTARRSRASRPGRGAVRRSGSGRARWRTGRPGRTPLRWCRPRAPRRDLRQDDRGDVAWWAGSAVTRHLGDGLPADPLGGGDEDDGRVGTVLGLAEQIGGDDERVGGVVGDDQRPRSVRRTGRCRPRRTSDAWPRRRRRCPGR